MNGNVGTSNKEEWRPPELRKLPIGSTATQAGKGNFTAADSPGGGPKQADAGGQIS